MRRWMSLIGAGAMAAAVTVSAMRSAGAQGRAASARRAYEAARGDAEELNRLTAVLAKRAPDAHPTQDVLARVNRVLATVGLPADSLQDLAQESDSPLGLPRDDGFETRRKTVRLTLRRMAPKQVGEFSQAWRTEGGPWKITHVQLDRAGVTPAPGAPAEYSVRFTLAATVVVETKP